MSWFQPRAELSHALIQAASVGRDAPILDVGGGASMLTAELLAEGYRNLTVLDVASGALAQARQRLGVEANKVNWVVGDVRVAPLADRSVALWHDRAVFHFLTDPAEQDRYLTEVRRVVRTGGFVLIATFASDGPSRCSGLPVSRYSPEELYAALDGGFDLVASRRELHRTPSGVSQPFTYCLCRYVPQLR